MDLFLPVLVFVVTLGGVLYVFRRSQRTVVQLGRHQIATAGATAAVPRPSRLSILGIAPQGGVAGKLATKVATPQFRTKAGKLLRQAGDPMPIGTYLLLRVVFLAGVTPLLVTYILRTQGLSTYGIILTVIGAFVTPNLPTVYVKRKARKRGREIERSLPDALDLLVVCVEGGLSLDGGLQQVGQRKEGLLADELRRVQTEMAAGMSRRDALQALTSRTTSQSLGILCTTIVQADKMGVSIATALRTLAETLRMRRRQEAETQARKAPIKMLPFLVFFMLPSLFIVILGPVAVSLIQFFQAAT